MNYIRFLFYIFSGVDIHSLRHEAEYFGITPLGKAKKVDYMFLTHRLRHLQPPHQKFLLHFSIHTEKSSIHR